ncbi:MAG: hypothetical protein LBK03_00335 [Bacteroidales bacterium]|jgi:hypothetical protein|nr:hypothetical protein [Bacteroidales bacterium]
MKKIAFFLPLALFVLFMPVLKAQEMIKQYIYLPYSYYFGVSMGNLAFSMPAGWGFSTPDFQKQKAKLTIDASGVFCQFNYEHYNGKFLFITPEGNQPVMELMITGSYADVTDSTAINSAFGQFSKVTETWPGTEKYQIVNDSYILTFNILTQDESEKKQCKEVIASATEHYGYLPDWAVSQSISYKAGDTTCYNQLGLSFVVPVDMSAEIRASQFKINERATLLTNQTLLSVLLESSESRFYSKEFSVEYGFYPKESETEIDNLVLYSRSYDMANYADACREKFHYNINGIQATVYQSGKKVPVLIVVIPAQDYVSVFHFSNITQENLPLAASFISSIYIDEMKRDPNLKAENDHASLEELVKLESPLIWPTLEFNASTPLKGKVVECEIPEANATLYVPALDGEMIMTPQYDELKYNKKAKKYFIRLSLSGAIERYDDCSEAIIESEDYDIPVSEGFYGHNASHTLALKMHFVDENLSAEQFTALLMEIVQCSNDIARFSTGTATVNGQKWYRFKATLSDEEGAGSVSVYVTEINNHVLGIMLQSDSEKEGDNYCRMLEMLLYKAKFR